MVRRFAAIVTSAPGDERFATCGSAYQPSERPAQFVRVRLPSMSDKFCTSNNRSLSLRKRPALNHSGSGDYEAVCK